MQKKVGFRPLYCQDLSIFPDRRQAAKNPVIRATVLSRTQEETDDILSQSEGGRQGNPLQFRSTWERGPDTEQGLSVATGYDMRDRRITIQHRERPTPANATKVLTQAAFQISNADILHDHKIVIVGQKCKPA